MRRMSSWGRLSTSPHEVIEVADRGQALSDLIRHRPGIAYGLGRSYGDACLNPGGVLWRTKGLDRFIYFDVSTGRLACEAGVVLHDIQQLAIARGWSLPVVPGTEFVTVGGAIANDVHGKNHHRDGTFCDHVLSLTLLRTDGDEIVCGPTKQREWFAATAGGLGLTGLITDVELQLRQVAGPWLEAETIAYSGLEEFLRLSDDSCLDWEHAVSWIDCTGGERGLFLRAKPVAVARNPGRQRSLAIPFTLPISFVNRLTLKPMNRLYWLLNRHHIGRRIVHYKPFLFPLDAVRDWNRLYGPAGFYQYQCVVPHESAAASLRDMLNTIARSGNGSVLAVLKTFGERWPIGLLSFARPGVTLALDFQNRAGIDALFQRLDDIVTQAGGRLYPAKDARMPRSMFESGYPRLPEFLNYRDHGMSSAMSRRLIGS